jgi:sugar fermentation stimulation protein A
MLYTNISEGIFVFRPNRFIAQIKIGDTVVVAHVKNTGCCKELLVSGVKVVLQKSDNPKRKTMYDLIAVWKNKRLINIDSQVPNKVFLEYLQSGQYLEGITCIRPEVTYGSSRFDFYVEVGTRKIFLEVKGVTLEENGVVMFPDAPTERGVKHLNVLIRCTKEGYEAHVVFVVQMSNVRYFTPNNKTHPAFGETLVAAQKAGVNIIALDCVVTKNTLEIGNPVPAKLTE